MARRLVLIRHAKSDWSEPVSDRERPVSSRGRRQAPAIGTWLRAQDMVPELALVSPARRASETWDLVASGIGDAVSRDGAPPVVQRAVEAYTFDGDDLMRLIHTVPIEREIVALVGHNPAIEELLEMLTGADQPMPTSSLAVIDPGTIPWSELTAGARLVTAGRPSDGPLRAFA